MPTSEEVFEFLDTGHKHTIATAEEKGGKGVFLRVYHWASTKEIPPLASLAEVKTLKGTGGKPCTRIGHLWYSAQPGWIKSREYTCLSCSECSYLRFGSCELGPLKVDPIQTSEIRFESGGRGRFGRSAIAGDERACRVKKGDLIGAECINTNEPYIVWEALGPKAIWDGDDSRCWMGMIHKGEEYIACRKYDKRSELVYSEMDKEFRLSASDCRIIFEKHRLHARPRVSKLNPERQVAKIYYIDKDEMSSLQCRVCMAGEDSFYLFLFCAFSVRK